MRRKFLLLLEMGLILAGLAVGWSAWKVNSVLEQPLHVTQERLLDVPNGTTPNRMFYRMQNEGLLDDAVWLRLYWRFNMAGTPLHTGEYRLTPGMTVEQLFDAWRRADVVQYNLTLVEGWTFRQVRAAVAKHEKIKHTLDGLSDSEVMDKLGHTGVFPEGRFFPDTYRFVRGMSDVELLQQAYMRLDEVLAKEWAERTTDLPYRDPYQALIMASLVEKETGIPQERGQIAGVFVRRLRLGMMLQTDPTVIYGMGERYNGKITRADLREPTPYNTYTITGLPPTPDRHGRSRSDSRGAQPVRWHQPVLRCPWRWQPRVFRRPRRPQLGGARVPAQAPCGLPLQPRAAIAARATTTIRYRRGRTTRSPCRRVYRAASARPAACAGRPCRRRASGRTADA